MRANIRFALLLLLTRKINVQLIKSAKKLIVKIALPVLFLTLLSGFQARSQDTIVTVQFANPSYVCSTQSYSLDVVFQCNISGFQLKGMNVRFIYPEDILAYTSIGPLATSYFNTGTNQILTGSPSSGMEMFGFPGAYKEFNGTVEKKSGNPNTYIPTSGWLTLFKVNFHVEDPEIMNDPDFCPSVIWDKREFPLQSGMIIPSGVVMNLVKTYSGPLYSCLEHVLQFNWQYDTIPGNPFGYPVNTNCISALRTYAPVTTLPICTVNTNGAVNVPVSVTNFNHVGHFNLVFEYDPLCMTYVGNTPNAIFTTQHGLLYVTDSTSTDGKNKITMKFQAATHTISLSDNDYLSELHFNFISGTTNMTWKTTNNSCHYVDTLSIIKCDQPYSDYYINGGLLAELAPITKIDSNVAFIGDFVTYAVKVWNFTNIHSGRLTLDYDPDVLSYYETVCNAAYTNIFEDSVLYQGRVQMGWNGNDTSLTDGSILAYITFQYLGGEAPLLWFDNGISCQYVNCDDIPLADEPSEDFYINGNVASVQFIWTGENSSDWNNSSNWMNDIVPGPFTNVILDPSSSPDNWPTFNGDFTLGENCKSLTLNDNAQFTISGDLTINPGNTLSFNGAGILQVAGNWTNSGVFNPGEGTVEFIGNTDGIIGQGVPSENYVAAFVLSTFTGGMTPITGGYTGPTGDNDQIDVPIGFNFNYLGINYSQLRLNTNGWISLNQTGENLTSGDNTILFSTSSPGTALAPWWDDLNADANTSVSYITEGVIPNRVFTSEWENILAFSSGATVRLNFQVKLYESNNIIEFCYGSVSGGTHSSAESASIGIKDATGGIGKFIEATHNSNTLVVAFLNSGTNWPSLNFRFTPPEENTVEVFYKLVNSKGTSALHIQKNVTVNGLDSN